MGVLDVKAIREYNSRRKDRQDKIAVYMGNLNYNNSEIEKLCKELTEDLGMVVTVDNIEAIHAERVLKITQALNYGNEVLDRIDREEQNVTSEDLSKVSDGLSNGINTGIKYQEGIAGPSESMSLPQFNQYTQQPQTQQQVQMNTNIQQNIQQFNAQQDNQGLTQMFSRQVDGI